MIIFSLVDMTCDAFLPARRYAIAVLAVVVCLSVRPSVCMSQVDVLLRWIKYCQEYFGFALPSVLWAKRVSKFESSFKCFLSDL